MSCLSRCIVLVSKIPEAINISEALLKSVKVWCGNLSKGFADRVVIWVLRSEEGDSKGR